MNFDLNSLERKLIITALTTPAFKDFISQPKLKRIIRDCYKMLLARLKADEGLHEEIKKSTEV
ncbi:MAG: hypothetical protein U9Q97_04755 [Acidobacteriota bacterium]|nr:hypothetical protein [Acidobacteriota bacterium]